MSHHKGSTRIPFKSTEIVKVSENISSDHLESGHEEATLRVDSFVSGCRGRGATWRAAAPEVHIRL